MTGSEFFLELQNAYDKAYSTYLDSDNANRLIKRSLYRLVDKLYSGNDTRKEDDELFSLQVKNETVSVTGGILPIDDLTYPYLHLLRMACVYKETVTFTYSKGIFYSTHNLRKGDTVEITGATDPAHNTTYTLTKAGKGKFYMDLTYVDGSMTINRTFEATPLRSYRKKSSYHTSEITSPKYEQSFDDNFLKPKSFTLEPIPTEAIVDYVMEPDVEIDVDDVVTDLNQYYTTKFLYRLIDECVKTFAEQTKDVAGVQMAAQVIIDNP